MRSREDIQEYQRAYREANLDRLREYAKKRYLAKREDLREQRRRRYASDPESELARNRKYQGENREAVLEGKRAWSRRWRKEKRGEVNAKTVRYRAAKLKATPKWSEGKKIADLYCFAADMGYHVDHIVPLRSKLVCGLHVFGNLAVIRPEENTRKGNFWWPDMWERLA